jgi:hypothetical protein
LAFFLRNAPEAGSGRLHKKIDDPPSQIACLSRLMAREDSRCLFNVKGKS